jgi:WD40 repeat protein
MVVPTGFQKWKFSTSGKRLAVGSTGSGIQIYDTATMNLLQTISLSGLDITGLVWGPLDSKLAVSLGSSPFIKVYNFETEAFMSDPATLPAGLTVGCDWSYEHNLLAVGHYNTPFVTIYQMPGFTKITNPSAGLPSGRPVFVKFSPSGRELYVPQTGYDGTRVYICPEFTFLGNAPWGSFDEVSWMEFNTRGSWVVYRYSYSLYLKRYASNGFTAIATLSSSYNKAMFTDHALGA